MVKRLDDLPSAIRELQARGATRGTNWTLPQIAEHLALTIDLTLGRMPRNEPSPIHLRPLRRFLARQMVLLQGRIPPNVPTLRLLTPPADTDLDKAVTHLKESIAALQHAAGPLPDHPFLGPMSKRAWLRFHLVHARHHLAMLNRERDAIAK